MKARKILSDDIVLYSVLAKNHSIDYRYMDTKLEEKDLRNFVDGKNLSFNKEFELMAVLKELELVEIGATMEELF